MKTFLAIAFLTFSFASSCPAQTTPPGYTSHQMIRGPKGFTAHSFRSGTDDGETEGLLLIEKEGRVVATIQGVRAVSFSPTDAILLVAEAVADDDLRHYLLNVGEGQFSRKENRADYVFGSRFTSKAVWSEDGKFLVLFDHPGLSEGTPTTIKVADKLGK